MNRSSNSSGVLAVFTATFGFGALIGLGVVLGGCNTEAYCFSDCPTGGTTSGTGGTGGESTTSGFSTSTGFQGTGGSDCGDTQSSLENCGACDHPCILFGADPQCVDGECKVLDCLEGQYDLDGLSENGCEYTCPVTTLTPEVCDGIDNDCDGLIDADDPDLAPPPALCNTSPGTPCEATQQICDPIHGWTCVYPAGVETVGGFVRQTETQCDGIDGNCDGSIDEWFVALGTSCNDGALGVCRDYGVIVCDPSVPTQTMCDLSALPMPGVAGPELCDGIDNDCNGLIDDALPDSAFDMVAIPGSSVMVDRYEASRPDSNAGAAGILESVACSKPNAIPWTGGGYLEATQACAARGPSYRLCTQSELETACRGTANTNYPYGNSYAPMSCNGVNEGSGAAVATGSLATCTSTPDPVFDLSGNVSEWTSTQTNVPAPPPGRIFALSGGSYLSPALGLACSPELQARAQENTLLPSIGFRCCKDP